MTPLRIGILGRGMISRFFVEALQQDSQIQWVASCDLVHERLKEDQAAGIFTTDNLMECVSSPLIDALIICTPAHTHEAVITQALECGKHVLCEKPLAATAGAAAHLLDLAEQQQRVLYTAFHRRFNKHLQRAKSLLEGKTILHVELAYLENILEHSPFGGWLQDASLTGHGCLLDNGVNALDALWELLGPLHIEEVHLSRRPHESWEVASMIRGKNQTGSTFSIALDWSSTTEQKHLTVTLAGGETITIDFLEGFTPFKSSLPHEYREVLNEFLQRINRPPQRDQRSLEIMHLVETSYRIAQTKNRF